MISDVIQHSCFQWRESKYVIFITLEIIFWLLRGVILLSADVSPVITDGIFSTPAVVVVKIKIPFLLLLSRIYPLLDVGFL